jgi:hypothetical protein
VGVTFSDGTFLPSTGGLSEKDIYVQKAHPKNSINFIPCERVVISDLEAFFYICPYLSTLKGTVSPDIEFILGTINLQI